MKKILLITLLLLSGMVLRAVEVEQNRQNLTYSLPMTEGEVKVEYDRVVFTQGVFWQYAERYLGKVDVITENSEYYELKSVSLRTRAVADEQKTFELPAAKSLPHIRLNGKGLLVAVGDIDVPATKAKDVQPAAEPEKKKCAMLSPLTEEQLRTGSMAKMAENTAKMIYRIREDRLNLMTGETEAADGEALKTMLRKLEQTEHQLTELFTGTRKVEHHSAALPLNVAQDASEAVLFRFSRYSGVVDADDLAGEPVYCDVTTRGVAYSEVKKTTKPVKGALYYNQPGAANVKITYRGAVLIEQRIDVAQLGVVRPLPLMVLKSGHGVLLNTSTGAIKEIR